jgi:hypothetical protein
MVPNPMDGIFIRGNLGTDPMEKHGEYTEKRWQVKARERDLEQIFISGLKRNQAHSLML